METKSKVLIVEDNRDMLSYLRIILRHYEVATEENGQAALEYLESTDNLPDIILSDIMMPVMDGLRFLTVVKGKSNWRHIPFILLTAKDEIDFKIKGLQEGVDDYILKPFNEQQLLLSIQRTLRNAEIRQQHWAEEHNSLDGPASEDGWFDTLRQTYLDLLADERLTLQYIASLLYVSPRKLQRKLKEEYGLSHSHYLRQLRLEEAMRLLENKQCDSVKNLASKVGYHDTKYFSRMFHQTFGQYPSEILKDR